MEVGGEGRVPAAYPRERDWASMLQEVEWATGPLWASVENFAVTSNPSLDRQARSE